jgi:hypothetical protein
MKGVPAVVALVFMAGSVAGCSGSSAPAAPAPTASANSSSQTVTFPYSVSFGTSPCFAPLWTRLLADRWDLRDAVTGRVISTEGTGYQSRCGFYIQYRLPATAFSQFSQVYIYDPRRQLVGLNQSNAGEPNVLLTGNGGPFKLSRDAVVNGPMLIDCSAFRSACHESVTTSSPAPPASDAYNRYTNPRFGFTTLWPTGFTAQPPPEDGDGQEWTDEGGKVSLTTYGDDNVLHHTPSEDLTAISSGLRVTYSNISGDIVTVSGYSGPRTIVYERDAVGAGSIDSLLWRYPSDQRSTWQAANTRTALAFTPGDLSSTH